VPHLVGEMKQLVGFAAWCVLGYWVVNKLTPAIQAKVEAMDLDDVWELWNEEEWM
jgi:hypothetical protein